jgi:hypothetical protein
MGAIEAISVGIPVLTQVGMLPPPRLEPKAPTEAKALENADIVDC